MRHMISLSSASWEVTPFTGKKGCYCAVQPDTLSLLRLIDLCNELGLVTDPRKFHCTVMYSPDKAPVLPDDYSFKATATITGLEWWAGHNNKGYLTATLHSPELEAQHAKLIEMGAEHTYQPYNPHVTLMSGVHLKGALSEAVIRLTQQLTYKPIPVAFDVSVVSDIKD